MIKRYYYEYMGKLIGFIVPKGEPSLRIDSRKAMENKQVVFPLGPYRYVVASDVLGHIRDVDAFLRDARTALAPDGRIVITQYSALWEPVLRLATLLKVRMTVTEQNWLSLSDIKNFAHLAGLQTVSSGTKMPMPVYIPGLSWLINNFLANFWPFSRLGLFHYIVLRRPEPRDVADSRPSLSIIVPARNESGTIERIATELPALGSFTEILFIEGNSTDDTYAAIERAALKLGQKRPIRYAKQDGKGKGDAVKKGFAMAKGDIVTIYDADMTVPPEEVAKFYEALVGNKGDMINGSRLVYPMEKQSMRVLNFIGNKFFSMAFSWILGQPIKDTLCGTKMLWKEDYERIERGRAFFGDFDPFGDFDLIFGAAKLNLKIVDVPVHYRERTYGETNISRWKHGWLLLKMTVFAMGKIKFI